MEAHKFMLSYAYKSNYLSYDMKTVFLRKGKIQYVERLSWNPHMCASDRVTYLDIHTAHDQRWTK